MNLSASPTFASRALAIAGWSLLAASVASGVAAASGGSAVPFARVLVLLAVAASLVAAALLVVLAPQHWVRIAPKFPLLQTQSIPFARAELLPGGLAALDALRSPLRRRMVALAMVLLVSGVGVAVVTALWPLPQPVTIGLRSGEPVDHGETTDGARSILVQLPFALQEGGLPNSAARTASIVARDIRSGTRSTLQVTPASEHSLRGGTLRLAGWSATRDIASATLRLGGEKGADLVLPMNKAVAWKGVSLTLREGRDDFFGVTGTAVAVEVSSPSEPSRVAWVFAGDGGAAMAARATSPLPAMSLRSVSFDPVLLLRWTPDASAVPRALLWVAAALAVAGWLLLLLLPPFVAGRDGDYLLVAPAGGRGSAAHAFALQSILTPEQAAELAALSARLEAP